MIEDMKAYTYITTTTATVSGSTIYITYTPTTTASYIMTNYTVV